MQTADVLVIGDDLAALAAACEIQPFADVVLVGRPPDHAPPALLGLAMEGTPAAGLAAASRGFYEGPAAALAGGPLISPKDLLLLASERQLAELEAKGATPAGAPIGRTELLSELPFLATQPPACGFLVDTAELDVAAARAAYARIFQERGGRTVAEAGRVLIEGDGAPWRISAGSAKFEAGVLVDAAGWFAEEIAVRAGVPPLGLTARRRTLLRFEPTQRLPAAMPMLLDVDGVRRLEAASGAMTAVVTQPEPLDPLAIRLHHGDGELALRLIERSTRLRAGRMFMRSSGYVAVTPDAVPVVGHDDFVPGFFWLGGEGPEGAALVPALARAAAGLLVDGVLPADLLELGLASEDLLPLRFHDQREP